MEFFWLSLFIILAFIEGISTNLITIWFSLGSLCAFLTTFITDSVLIQIIVFFSVSIISLILTKPLVDKYFTPKKVRTNVDSLIDEIGVVTEDITKDKNGRVNIRHKSWLASSKEEIKKGSHVKVKKIEGVKLIVTKED